ncbi:addiction module protein [Ilumatobacter nonamiensis]|uniref:addiction module protein n=1 Tax=Ilumatobacter nonamiensis TaxID=467093 RepID=UPI0009FBE1EC|nr:addiction module protein [Ilumatobacter nonamiensis]
MTEVGRAVLAEALDLPVRERADIAAELLASLRAPEDASDHDVERLWADEIRRRVERVESGESATVPWDDVRAEAERRLAQR